MKRFISAFVLCASVAFGQEVLDVQGYREKAKTMLRPQAEAVASKE